LRYNSVFGVALTPFGVDFQVVRTLTVRPSDAGFVAAVTQALKTLHERGNIRTMAMMVEAVLACGDIV
jgi:hypothetical protein